MRSNGVVCDFMTFMKAGREGVTGEGEIVPMKTFPKGRRTFRSFEKLLVFEIMAVLEQLVGLDYYCSELFSGGQFLYWGVRCKATLQQVQVKVPEGYLETLQNCRVFS